MSLSRSRGALGAAACLLVVSLPCGPARAHAVLRDRIARAAAPYRAVLAITHGCNGSPTRSVTVSVPDGAIGARPMAKPGWTIATRRGPYGRSHATMHGSSNEGVREITWSGGSLPDDEFDEFTFAVRLADDLAPGTRLSFPVDQVCDTGAYHWTQLPAPGQESEELSEPAPVVLVEAVPNAAATGGAAVRVGDLVIAEPWMRATPGGASVAGGYLRITNSGKEPDRLLSASMPLAERGEVHEMSMDGGVMKMRPVEGGLPIAPGQTVELRPGGFHLMFTGLRGGLTEGETVRGTLTFARAGTVEVTFAVGGLGAQGPGGHRH